MSKAAERSKKEEQKCCHCPERKEYRLPCGSCRFTGTGVCYRDLAGLVALPGQAFVTETSPVSVLAVVVNSLSVSLLLW